MSLIGRCRPAGQEIQCEMNKPFLLVSMASIAVSLLLPSLHFTLQNFIMSCHAISYLIPICPGVH